MERDKSGPVEELQARGVTRRTRLGAGTNH